MLETWAHAARGVTRCLASGLQSLPGKRGAFLDANLKAEKIMLKLIKKWTEKYEKLLWKLQICLIIKTEDGNTGRECLEVLHGRRVAAFSSGPLGERPCEANIQCWQGRSRRPWLVLCFSFLFFFFKKKNSYVFGSLQYQSIGISLTKKFHEDPSLATAAHPNVKKVKRRKSHAMETHSGTSRGVWVISKGLGLWAKQWLQRHSRVSLQSQAAKLQPTAACLPPASVRIQCQVPQ